MKLLMAVRHLKVRALSIFDLLKKYKFLFGIFLYPTGLMRIVKDYLATFKEVDPKTKQNIDEYLQLIEQRANGTQMTPAAWMRKFIMNHPEYKQDSVVTDRINYDLMWNIFQMSSENNSDKLAASSPSEY